MNIAAKTDVGLVRSSNQDGFQAGLLNDGTVAWAVVCDGMGGASGGNIASQTALESMVEDIQNNFRTDMSANSLMLLLKTAVFNANTKVYEKAKGNPALSGMGTTVVAAILRDESLYLAHVGDSRAYLINSDKIRQVTKDHSVVQNMIEQGRLSEKQARSHPDKNIITRALGVEDKVDVDYTELDLEPGDRLLLCTDGLTNMVEDKEIFSLFRKHTGDSLAEELIGQANLNGGNDNSTVVIIDQEPIVE